MDWLDWSMDWEIENTRKSSEFITPKKVNGAPSLYVGFRSLIEAQTLITP